MLELFPASSVSKLRQEDGNIGGKTRNQSQSIFITAMQNCYHWTFKMFEHSLAASTEISICFVWNIANLQHSVEKYPKQVAKFFISCFEHLQFLCSCSFLSNHFISDLICWLGPQHHTPFQFNGQPCIEVMLGNVSHKTSGENLWPHLDLVSTKKVSQSPFF